MVGEKIMVTIAVHIVFFWVLGLTLNAKVVDQVDDKPKIEQKQETNQNG